jgi:hypothetical protein
MNESSQRRLPALCLAVAVGCGPAADLPPLAEPLVVHRAPPAGGCEGLVLVDRLDLGGRFGSVAADEGWIYAATASGLDVYPRDGDARRVVVPLPGEPVAVLAADGRVQVAAGTAGLVEVEPGGASWASRLADGGEIVALARSGDATWLADRTGRVLRVPDADGGGVLSVEVDGHPGSIAAWGEGVVVAAGRVGLLYVEPAAGRLVVHRAPWETGRASLVVSGGGAVWTAAGQVVRRLRAGEPEVVFESPEGVQALLPVDGGILVGTTDRGVWFWDEVGDELEPWDTPLVADRPDLSVAGLAATPDGGVLVGSEAAGVLQLKPTQGRWTVTDAFGTGGGEVDSLDRVPGGVAVGVTAGNDVGRVVLLEPRQGAFGLAAEVDAGGWPVRVLQVGDELLVGLQGAGLGLMTLDGEGGGRVDLVALPGVTVTSLAAVDDNEVVAVAGDRLLHWLRRNADGWNSIGVSEIPRLPFPVDAVFHDGTLWTATAAFGMLHRLEGPGAPPEPVRALAGAASTAERLFRLAGMSLDGNDLLISLPTVGLERVPTSGPGGDVLRMLPGAWDVEPWGDVLAVARDTAGVSLVSRGPEMELLATCDLPGRAKRVLPLGDQLLVGAGGTVFVLERRPAPPGP